MLLTLILICNMLIYSVLSIPLYRIICTTSTIGTDFSPTVESVIGAATGVIVLGNSIHYFINTSVFLAEGGETIMTCCYYAHDMLSGFSQYTAQTQIADDLRGVCGEIPAIILRFSIIDIELSTICHVRHYVGIALSSNGILLCNHDVVEIKQFLYKVNINIASENNDSVEIHKKRQKIYEVLFLTRCSTEGIIEFYALQERVFVVSGETTLVFFRVHNPTTYNISCLTVYFLYPDYLSIYFYKLQCFCFEILHLEPKEVLDLPVLFYISHDIVADVRVSNKFIVYYVLFPLERMQIDIIGIGEKYDLKAPLQFM